MGANIADFMRINQILLTSSYDQIVIWYVIEAKMMHAHYKNG